MNNNNNMIDQVLLLGLVLILGGSSNIRTAVVTTVVLILTSILLWFVSQKINKNNLGGMQWILYLAIGISLSYSAYISSAYLYPELFQHSGIYLLLIGVTPLTYYGCKNGVSFSNLWKRFNIFFISIILVSFFRELIGFGSVLGLSFFETGFAPLSSFQGAPGAFILTGTIWLIYRWLLSLKIIDDNLFKIKEGAESE